MNFRFSIHAEQELQKRRIPREVAEAVVRNPQQKVPETTPRNVLSVSRGD